ncbi:hypothetical protein FY534_02865 [Alicyclobacillus sp. TC]|uniref:hypothetical protein n=1 Tax=Alicyclobacillus sp. TC TaxID=2606450 RepID=UPI0019336F33|nr:hypothetical protein [Alicyclobacillus sp. TC]QRF22738.1 hypothetical protein FY534_02865 [Alicyclobacillus sp. TC]
MQVQVQAIPVGTPSNPSGPTTPNRPPQPNLPNGGNPPVTVTQPNPSGGNAPPIREPGSGNGSQGEFLAFLVTRQAGIQKDKQFMSFPFHLLVNLLSLEQHLP